MKNFGKDFFLLFLNKKTSESQFLAKQEKVKVVFESNVFIFSNLTGALKVSWKGPDFMKLHRLCSHFESPKVVF